MTHTVYTLYIREPRLRLIMNGLSFFSKIAHTLTLTHLVSDSSQMNNAARKHQQENQCRDDTIH